MSPRLLGKGIAAGRVLIGAGLLARPSLFTTPWLGPGEGAGPASQVLGRAVGARDLVIGVGALAGPEDSLAAWLAAAIIADSADFFATVAAGGALPRSGRLGVAATALSGAVLGGVALRGVRRASS